MRDNLDEINVEHECKVITRLNASIIARKNLTNGDVEKIKKLHIFKHILFEKMLECPEEELAPYNEYVVACEYALQRAWGFPEDENYHRFWNTPRCECPKIDNEDAYPTGYYAHMVGCPVHE